MTNAARGALAGIFGTSILALDESLERRLLGRLPIYAAAVVLRRLVAKSGRARPFRYSTSRAIASVMRLGYGAALGATYGVARSKCPPYPTLLAASVLAATIWSFEIACMPLLGATPGVRSWPQGELSLLALHTSSFAVGTAFAYERLTEAT